MKKAILILHDKNPEAAERILEIPKYRGDFDKLLVINPAFKNAITSIIEQYMREPIEAETVMKPDNRNELIAKDAKFEGGISFATSHPNTFNPITSNSANFNDIKGLINDFLCIRDPAKPDEWIGVLADNATITNDFTVYTFWLKPNIKWHKPALNLNDPKYLWLKNANRNVTAEDFLFTLSLILNKNVDAAHSRNYYSHKNEPDAEIRIINRYLFQMIWGRKTYQSKSFSLALRAWPKFIYNKDELGVEFTEAEIGSQFNKHWFAVQDNIIGCGAYIFKH